MRMTWRREFRWLLALWLIDAAWHLTQKEAPLAMLQAWAVLFENFKNDRKFNTVPMRGART